MSKTLEATVGDRHFGLTKRAGVRERSFAEKGEVIANIRQVSIVADEELAAIASIMGVPSVTGSDLGANIVLRGIEDFTETVPARSELRFSRGVTLRVTSANDPCRFPGEVIRARHPEAHTLFVKAAKGRRGVVARVLKRGTVHVGDLVDIRLPE